MNKYLKRMLATFLILAFGALSFYAGNKIGINTGSKVTMSTDEFNKLSGDSASFPRLETLKQLIDSKFLFKVEKDKVEDSVYKGLFQGLGDPYSVYMDQGEFKSLMESTQGEYAGVGIVVSSSEDNHITIVSPIEGTPGEKAGLKTKDKIIKVEGIPYTGKEMDKAVKVMRGKPNTKVKITISRPVEGKSDEVFDVELVRQLIKLHTVKGSTKGDVGYISVSQFDVNTAKEFTAELEKQKSKGVKGIILDLRNNPGGLLQSTVKIADMLLPEGIIVKTVDKNGKSEEEKSGASMDNIPMVVLVNGGSASASEILTGALMDYNRATVIGTKTFGKGIVQQIFPLTNKGTEGPGVKLTVSEYFTPKGTKINKLGITPNIVLELPKDVKINGMDNLEKDIQLKKALDVLNEKIK